MNKFNIIYKGKSYPAIEINNNDLFPGDFDDNELIISVLSLWNTMEDDYNNEDEEAIELDNRIFFYADDEFINNNPSYDEFVKYMTARC